MAQWSQRRIQKCEVYRLGGQTEGWTTNNRWSEKLIWTFGSGKLKKIIRKFVFFSIYSFNLPPTPVWPIWVTTKVTLKWYISTSSLKYHFHKWYPLRVAGFLHILILNFEPLLELLPYLWSHDLNKLISYTYIAEVGYYRLAGFIQSTPYFHYFQIISPLKGPGLSI